MSRPIDFACAESSPLTMTGFSHLECHEPQHTQNSQFTVYPSTTFTHVPHLVTADDVSRNSVPTHTLKDDATKDAAEKYEL